MTKKIGNRRTVKKRKKSPSPSYFLSLTLENVRCFGVKQSLDLSDGRGRPAQWTVILGDNGVGKTTVLQVLSALVPTREPLLGEFIINELGPERLGPIPKEKIHDIQYPTIMSGPFLKIGESLLSHIERKKSLDLTASIQVGAKLNGKVDQKGKTSEIFLRKKQGDYEFYAKYSEAAEDFVCFGYGASRRMGDASLSNKQDSDQFASLFDDDASLRNAEEWLLQCDYAAHAAKTPAARKRAKKRRDEVKDVLVNLLPDIDDIRFSQLTEKAIEPGVEVKTPYGWVPVKEISLGYRTLVAWMVDFASRMFDHYSASRNPLAEAAVVLVDEIDLHLHPKWQRTLMRYLSQRFPNTQFIATAHSPLVVQAASDANIALLKREGDHVVVDNDVKAIHGWRVDPILTSDLFGLDSARPPQLDHLFEERTKVLSKAFLTKKDRERLREIETEIGVLPTGETPEDMEAMDVIRRAAKRLKTQG
jgi:energy-coupling factor transporter ATP-binding protein EcfA2